MTPCVIQTPHDIFQFLYTQFQNLHKMQPIYIYGLLFESEEGLVSKIPLPCRTPLCVNDNLHVGMSDPPGHFVLFCKLQKGGLGHAKRSQKGIQSPFQMDSS